LSYGTKITEVAHNVMNKVRYVVESMTGLKVFKSKLLQYRGCEGGRMSEKDEA